jgi:Archaeal/vacuolar-type H+-ATPase subunit I
MASRKKSFGVGMASSTKITENNTIKDMKAKQNFNFQYIHRDKIDVNPLNKRYAQDDIEQLKESIISTGLLHNICLTKNEDTDRYRLISGERRWHAIGLFTEEEYRTHFPSGIPSHVMVFDSETDEEIALIAANVEDRDESQEKKRDSILRLKELYELKREQGDTQYKNINKMIAEKTKMSTRQVTKYTNTAKLIPELQELFNKEAIKIDDASNFSVLSEEAQRKILEMIQRDGKVNSENLQTIKKQEAEAKELQKSLSQKEDELRKKESLIEELTKQVKRLEQKNESSPDDVTKDEIKELKEAKEKAEKDRASLRLKIEKLEEDKKQREQRNIEIPTDELKRIETIAKLEQTIEQFENSFNILKTGKKIIIQDQTLRSKIEILANRFNSLLEK